MGDFSEADLRVSLRNEGHDYNEHFQTYKFYFSMRMTSTPLLVIPLRRWFRIACSFKKNWYGWLFTMNPPHFILISSFVAVRSHLLVVVALLYVWRLCHFL